jgi:CheY-like chemotaxis protein
MPIMDGLKLVSLMKSNPLYREIPVVIITTEGAQEDRERPSRRPLLHPEADPDERPPGPSGNLGFCQCAAGGTFARRPV